MITEQDALNIARNRAIANGWAFGEPIEIIFRQDWFKRKSRFEIKTNVMNLGASAKFVVNAITGEIISEGYIPR